MDLTQAEAKLAQWQIAKQAVLNGNSYELDGQMLTISDLTKIHFEIERFSKLIIAIQQLTAWENASLKLATAQIYSFRTPSGERTVHRVDSESVLAQIKYWKTRIKNLDPTHKNTKQLSYSLASFK